MWFHRSWICIRAVGSKRFSYPGRDTDRSHAKATLQQWGRLYAYVSIVWRELAIDLIVGLLIEGEERSAEGKYAREFLFTDSFLTRCLQEARNDYDLSKSDKKLAEAAANRKKKGKRSSNWYVKPRRSFHSSFGSFKFKVSVRVSRIVDVGAKRRKQEAAISAGPIPISNPVGNRLLPLIP